MSPTSAAKHQAKRVSKSRKCAALFGWPSDELVIRDLSCAVEKSIMLHGRMYITAQHVRFYSSLFAGVTLSLPIDQLLSECQVNQALIFPNAIKLFVKPGAGSTEAPAVSSYFFFGSFALGGRLQEGRPPMRSAMAVLAFVFPSADA
jgi:hypothetical protein